MELFRPRFLSEAPPGTLSSVSCFHLSSVSVEGQRSKAESGRFLLNVSADVQQKGSETLNASRVRSICVLVGPSPW